MAGLNCPRYLWVSVHDPARLPPISAETQAAFDNGNLIGNLAKKLYSNGIEIDRDNASTVTKQMLLKNVPLFEASFSFASCYCKVDILVPSKDGFDIIEVKGSTSVKEEHLLDVAFQKHVLLNCGLKINNCYLMHINNSYIRSREIDVSSLFTIEDISLQVDSLIVDVPSNVTRLLEVLSLPEPNSVLGIDCVDPYSCTVCCPTSCEIFDLYRLGTKVWPLYNTGCRLFSEIPADFKLSEKQQLQVSICTAGKIHIDTLNLNRWLSSLSYPLYYLDFETVNPAVPLWDGCKPYQQIPFQYSLHVVSSDGTIKHFEYLGSGIDDPRVLLKEKLVSELGSSGTIIAHNASFEKKVLSDLGLDYDLRFADLIDPFRNFWYYSPLQHGSCSIKKVLPALIGKDYSTLVIQEGGTAQREWMRITFTDTDSEDLNSTREALLAYCEQDTLAMVEIVQVLREKVNSK